MNVLVTGVSKGLGLRIARVLLEKGNRVYGISRTKTVELESALQEYPGSFEWLAYDLQNSDDVYREVFKGWIGSTIPVQGFVNNAAAAYDDLITNLNTEQLERMYRINVFTPMVFTKYTIRNMLLHNTSGSILHISSISAHTGYKGLAMYASTKGALEAFSKNTAREWGEKGIRSNCIVSGFMDTEMSSTLSKDQKNRIYQRTALKLPVDMESVSGTIAFLLSADAKSITGQNIHVDSGTI